MHDDTKHKKFIELRSRGWSFARIATELEIAKQTAINWSRKFQYEINNLRAVEIEALHQQLFSTREDRLRTLAERMQKLEGELVKRDLAQVSTAKLYQLIESLQRQIHEETGDLKFTSPLKDIPNNEFSEEVMDWKP